MKTQSKSGFSIIELLLVMIAIAILSLTIGAVIYSSWKSWTLGQEVLQMQRDASLVMRVLSKEIRRTPIENITAGSSLTCGTQAFTVSGNDMLLNGQLLVSDTVDSFNSVKDGTNGTVAVSLTVSSSASSSTIDATFYSRN